MASHSDIPIAQNDRVSHGGMWCDSPVWEKTLSMDLFRDPKDFKLYYDFYLVTTAREEIGYHLRSHDVSTTAFSLLTDLRLPL